MTLQPLSPVLFFYLLSCSFLFLFFIACLDIIYFLARAKGGVSAACRVGYSRQATNQLLLQNINCKWYQHSWRIFCSSKSSWKSLPSSCKSFICYIWFTVISLSALDLTDMFLLFVSQDYSQQPPAQELIARDLHDNEWKFRHIFRGQFSF